MDILERVVVKGQTSWRAVLSWRAVVMVFRSSVAVWWPAPPMWIMTGDVLVKVGEVTGREQFTEAYGYL